MVSCSWNSVAKTGTAGSTGPRALYEQALEHDRSKFVPCDPKWLCHHHFPLCFVGKYNQDGIIQFSHVQSINHDCAKQACANYSD